MFKVGDVVILVDDGYLAPNVANYSGEEFTISGEPEDNESLFGYGFPISHKDGSLFLVMAHCLRKKDEGARDWFNKNIRIKDEVSTV